MGLSGQDINRETLELNNNIYEMNLTDIYRMFHPNSKEHIFYSAVHLRLSKSD